MNHAPCIKQCIRCCRTNSKDSLYSLARILLEDKLSQVDGRSVAENSLHVPNGHLAHDVVLELELAHLPLTDGLIFALVKVLLDLVPRAHVLLAQRILDPADGGEQSSHAPATRQHSLAAHKRSDAREVITCSCALVPHPQEEVRRERVHLVEVQEERLERRRRGVCRAQSVQRPADGRALYHTHIRGRKWPSAPTIDQRPRSTPSRWDIVARMVG